MDPDLAKRLRRFGEQVDQAAVAAQAGRPLAPPSANADADDTDELATVVPFVATRPNRRFQLITGAAAAAIVVLAGALITWRVVGDDDLGPADSGPSTVNTTAQPSTTATTTASTVDPTTTLPAIPLGGPSSTSSTSTSTTTTVSPSNSTATASARTCPTGYHAYDAAYPIRICDRGPAVRLIQQRVGAPTDDSFFGPATRQSVRVFQELNGLEVDGLVGRETWARLFPDGAPGVDADLSGTVDPWEVP